MRRATQSLAADRILSRFHEASARVRDEGLSRVIIDEASPSGDTIRVDGVELVNFGSCSYLGLGTDPRLAAAAKAAIDRYGTSYSSSTAYTAVSLYGDLQPRIDSIFGVPSVLAPTTTLAHLSALPVLIRPGETALLDSYAHTSLQMAAQMLAASEVEIGKVDHSDLAGLERAVTDALEGGARRVWYLADGVYSMAGDSAPIAELQSLLDRIPELWLYVDDAHGFSWTGPNGAGLMVGRTGWHPRMVVAVGFAKSFGSAGAAVASMDADLIDKIGLCGAPLSFGGPIPPPTLGASVASADIHLSAERDELEAQLRSRMDLVNRTARQLGLPFASFEATPIWFLEIGAFEPMLDVCHAMWNDGFYVNGAMWPIVAQGHAGVRFTVTNALPAAAIETMLERLAHHYAKVTGAALIEVDLTAREAVATAQDAIET